MIDTIRSMPKAELHAHLNGSITLNTVKKLVKLREKSADYRLEESIEARIEEMINGGVVPLEKCFKIFEYIHKITDTPEAIYIATRDVIQDFVSDNVLYLELRTTPRFFEGSIENYADAVIRAIEDCRRDALPIVVKLLLSINRSQGMEMAEEVVKLLLKLGCTHSDMVVGLDVSGNMIGSEIITLFPLLQIVRNSGLRVTVHTAEIQNDEETEAILNFEPDRIGHGTYIFPQDRSNSSTHLLDLLKKKKIPVELCLTSNIVCKTVNTYKEHQLGRYLEHDIPFTLCTDDKGVFQTTLSDEYLHASNTFGWSLEQIWKFSIRSLDYAFLTSTERENLQAIWKSWKRDNFKLFL